MKLYVVTNRAVREAMRPGLPTFPSHTLMTRRLQTLFYEDVELITYHDLFRASLGYLTKELYLGAIKGHDAVVVWPRRVRSYDEAHDERKPTVGLDTHTVEEARWAKDAAIPVFAVTPTRVALLTHCRIGKHADSHCRDLYLPPDTDLEAGMSVAAELRKVLGPGIKDPFIY